MRSTAVLLVAIVLLPACDDCNQKSTPPAASASASATAPPASASAPATPAPSASVSPSGKMAHCPVAVPGAKTAIADVPNGVTLTVTGGDPAATADIRARMAALLESQKNQGPGVHHTGTGEGGGLLGRCPIVLKDTTVVAADVESGTKITVTAKNPEEVDWLRRETRDREDDLQKASGSGGERKMLHCPSAAEGATTTIKNTPDGVSLLVTASAADVTKDIRERAKHLAEVAAEDAGAAGAATHTGEGSGGGNVGRCPVVLKDTAVKVKDIPGGSQIDVKAKSAAEVAKLQAETRERAAKFQLPGAAGSGSAGGAPSPAPSAKPGK